MTTRDIQLQKNRFDPRRSKRLVIYLDSALPRKLRGRWSRVIVIRVVNRHWNRNGCSNKAAYDPGIRQGMFCFTYCRATHGLGAILCQDHIAALNKQQAFRRARRCRARSPSTHELNLLARLNGVICSVHAF